AGKCSYSNAANGTACNDGNACTQSDTCQSGTCTGGNPVTCTALSACHDVGTCNPANGQCSNPPKANGTACNDGNGCTQTDTCQSGTCTGGNPVTCTAISQCHNAGTCNPANGQCSNPTKANGTACNDGNGCTQSDTCQSGTCTGGSAVTCTALSQCHNVGTCNPATGACSNPTKANGTACNDGNGCTQTDTCQSGTCTGGNPVTCTALSQCHDVGTCNPANGQCSNPTKANGTACSDGNGCTLNDTCQSGTCTGGALVACSAKGQCYNVGTCNPADGKCSTPPKPAGASCNDDNACTQTDTCNGSGACVGGNPKSCNGPIPECYTTPGTCNPANGVCSYPFNNGASCDDGIFCTKNDSCSSGSCQSGPWQQGCVEPLARHCTPEQTPAGPAVGVLLFHRQRFRVKKRRCSMLGAPTMRAMNTPRALLCASLLPLAALSLVAGCKKDEEKKTPAAGASASAPAPARPSAKPPEVPFETLVAQSKPLAPAPQEQVAGPIKIKAMPCTIEGGNPLSKSTSDVLRAVRVVGDRLWVVGQDEKVQAYKIEPGADCKLSIDKRIAPDGKLTLGAKARTLSTDDAGNLYVASGVFGGALLGKDGKLRYNCDARPGGYVALHPKGTWGIGHFANSTVAKLDFSPTACKSAPWVLQDLGQPARKGPFVNVNTVGFLGDTVLVGGILAKEVNPDEPRVVVAMDAAGKELFRFGNTAKGASGDDRFGWIHAISPCTHGICVVDSNNRRLSLWKAKGEFVAGIQLGKLLGLSYPTINDLHATAAGSYLIAGQSREGNKVAEGIIYRVTGI
ncbi:MAG: hypothetical protein MUF64_25515, partial [Polyangiaceae bacterium]|nr:hypothetical protein [Polyangiaceae bacterium]